MQTKVGTLLLTVFACLVFVPFSRGQGSPPVILVQPTNRVTVIGSSTSFFITATGAPPLFYRWWKNGSPMPISTNRSLPLVTNRTLILTNLQAGDAGSYQVVVSNFFGAATSFLATLQVILQKPVILAQPQDVPLCPGGSNSFLNVSASGAQPLSYQWRFNDGNIPGATSSFLVVPGSAANIGNYTVVITNVAGAVTSRVARLEPKLVIYQNPDSRTILAGAGVTFAVGVQSCGAVSYQWRFFGTNLPGANQSAYDISGALPRNSGPYDVVVTDSYSSVTSLVAQLFVQASPPVILSQPQDRFNVNGSNVVFVVSYDGSPAPSLQWRFNGADIPTQTNSFLSILPLPANEGGYSVVLSNISGVVTSRVATLSLAKYPPQILPWNQPQDQVICSSNNASYLTVFASSPYAYPAAYQWRHDGTNIPGANDYYHLLAGRREDAGDYTVVVSNPFGAVTSTVAHVTLGPVITQQPQDATEPSGGSFQFNVGVNYCGPVAFQWRKNGVNIPGATNYFLDFYSLVLADSGDYSVVLTHHFGAITSQVARLEVFQEPPSINPDTPADLEVHAGDFADFGIDYGPGAPQATLQWRFNGVPIPGETNAVLSFPVLSPAQQGRYSVVLSNSVGSVTSRLARLTILFSPPFIIADPLDLEVSDGSYANFYVAAEGAPPPSYQWLFNGSPLPGETNDYLSFLVSGTSRLGRYSVIASNLLGAVTSYEAVLTRLVQPPVFTIEPPDQTFSAGFHVALPSFATGAPAPAYQWLFNGAIIPGATNNYLQFVAGFSNQIGGYSVIASNEIGSVTSRVAMINIVLSPPLFITQPASASLVAGESANLYAQLYNNIPAFFQWQRNGTNLLNETNVNLLLRSVSTNDVGDYLLVARNDLGSATSQVARLEVRLPGPLEHWTWRNPLPQGNDLGDVAFGNDRHVAVGWGGGVAISVNGSGWFDAHRDVQARYRTGIAFGNGVFVTLDNSRPQTSTNGVDWVDREFGPGFDAVSVAFGNGRFVATTYYQDVAISTNGVDWEIHSTGPLSGFLKVIYGGGLFVAATRGFLDPSGDGVATSPDGINWTLHGIPPSITLADIAYGDGRFVGIPSYYQHYVVISTNGTDWVYQPLPESRSIYAQTIASGNGIWVVGGYSVAFGGTNTRAGLEYSTDTIHWTTVPGVGTNTVRKVLFDGTRFTAVGYYGFLATSTNGIEWTVINPGSDLNLRGIMQANGLFITVGNGGMIYTSTDGREWTRRESGVTGNLRSAIFYQNRFIIVGGDDLTGTGIVLVSTDAIHWEPQTANGSLYGIAHNGERLVAVGDAGNIATSLDGYSWTNLTVGPAGVSSTGTYADLNAVIWTGTQFLAVGKNGTIVGSATGLNWASTGPNGGKNLKGIAYGNGLHVAVANDARIYTSYDATTWFRWILQPQQDFEDITFGGGRFMAVGENGLVFTSTDGTNWLRRPTVCDNDLRGVIYSEGSYYVAGNNETILQSAQADTVLRIIRLPGAGSVQLEILAEAGRACRVQISSDLTQWDQLYSFTAGTQPTRYTNSLSGTSARRFYRVISP